MARKTKVSGPSFNMTDDELRTSSQFKEISKVLQHTPEKQRIKLARQEIDACWQEQQATKLRNVTKRFLRALDKLNITTDRQIIITRSREDGVDNEDGEDGEDESIDIRFVSLPKPRKNTQRSQDVPPAPAFTISQNNGGPPTIARRR